MIATGRRVAASKCARRLPAGAGTADNAICWPCSRILAYHTLWVGADVCVREAVIRA